MELLECAFWKLLNTVQRLRSLYNKWFGYPDLLKNKMLPD